MTRDEQLQFAREAIRFMNERIPGEDRHRMTFMVVLADVEDPGGPVIVSPLMPQDLVFFLLDLARRASGEPEVNYAAPAPEAS